MTAVRHGVLALLALVACSDDPSPAGSTSSSSSSSSSGGAPASSQCSFTGTLSGGVEGTIAVNGCGAGDSDRVSVAEADILERTSLGVRFKLEARLTGGELGPRPLQSLEIFKLEGRDVPELVWRSTTCTIELTRNERSPTETFENRHLIAGKGSCPGPLEAVAPNTRAAVALTPFEFGAFVDPD